MADELKDLISEFHRLGIDRPESWASSQLKEGIPQLQRARVLYKLWAAVVTHDNPGWVERERRSYARVERARPGSGEMDAPHVPVIDRMLAAGISMTDITTLVREMQAQTLKQICATLDDSGRGPTEAAGTYFGIFEVDSTNAPIRALDALHENVNDFDQEAATRRKRAMRGAR